jgi:hypothetical protein
VSEEAGNGTCDAWTKARNTSHRGLTDRQTQHMSHRTLISSISILKNCAIYQPSLNYKNSLKGVSTIRAFDTRARHRDIHRTLTARPLDAGAEAQRCPKTKNRRPCRPPHLAGNRSAAPPHRCWLTTPCNRRTIALPRLGICTQIILSSINKTTLQQTPAGLSINLSLSTLLSNHYNGR